MALSCVGCVSRSVSCGPRMLWGPHDAVCNKTHTGDWLATPFWLLRDTFICHGTIIWFRGTHKFVIEYPEHVIDVRQCGSSVSLSWSDSRTRWSEHYTSFRYVQVFKGVQGNAPVQLSSFLNTCYVKVCGCIGTVRDRYVRCRNEYNYVFYWMGEVTWDTQL
jgi:hypothetical protein